MENFPPYITITDTDTALHLKEPKWRQKLLFILLRILPLFIIVTPLLLIGAADGVNNQSKILFVVMLAIPAIILSNLLIISETEITPVEILIKTNKLFGVKQNEILISDIDRIVCKRKRGKHKGFMYFAISKQEGKKYRFLRFSRIFMSEEKKQLLNNKLEIITKIPVENI